MKKSIPIWMAWHRARTTAWPHRPIRRSVRLPRELMMRDTDASKAAARERSVQMLRTAFGPAIIEALDDPDIGEVMLNPDGRIRSEEHTSELQSLMRISYAVFCLKKKN